MARLPDEGGGRLGPRRLFSSPNCSGCSGEANASREFLRTESAHEDATRSSASSSGDGNGGQEHGRKEFRPSRKPQLQPLELPPSPLCDRASSVEEVASPLCRRILDRHKAPPEQTRQPFSPRLAAHELSQGPPTAPLPQLQSAFSAPQSSPRPPPGPSPRGRSPKSPGGWLEMQLPPLPDDFLQLSELPPLGDPLPPVPIVRLLSCADWLLTDIESLSPDYDKLAAAGDDICALLASPTVPATDPAGPILMERREDSEYQR